LLFNVVFLLLGVAFGFWAFFALFFFLLYLRFCYAQISLSFGAANRKNEAKTLIFKYKYTKNN